MVESVEELGLTGDLNGAENFFFADNSVSEDAYFKGSSGSLLLFELVLQLKRLEIKWGIRLHIIHVAGTRMMLQGIDNLSCGCLNGGVTKDARMEIFIPLGCTAVQSSESLLS